MYKKKTLRHMQSVTRRYARVLNDLDGVARRLKNLTQDIARLELDSTALHNRHKHDAARSQSNGAELEKRIDAVEIFYDPALKDVDHTPIDKATQILFGPAPEDLLRQQQEATDEL
jgi:hypothetical protein